MAGEKKEKRGAADGETITVAAEDVAKMAPAIADPNDIVQDASQIIREYKDKGLVEKYFKLEPIPGRNGFVGWFLGYCKMIVAGFKTPDQLAPGELNENVLNGVRFLACAPDGKPTSIIGYTLGSYKLMDALTRQGVRIGQKCALIRNLPPLDPKTGYPLPPAKTRTGRNAPTDIDVMPMHRSEDLKAEDLARCSVVRALPLEEVDDWFARTPKALRDAYGERTMLPPGNEKLIGSGSTVQTPGEKSAEVAA